MSSSPPEITKRVRTLNALLHGFLDQHQQQPERPFCFILGAGASKESGIKTGQELAKQWLDDIHRDEDFSGISVKKWANAASLGIDGFDPEKPERHYSKLYERRFRDNEERGHAFLESVMHGAEPSFGYSVLAYLLSEHPHKIVITTNFDNMVADALAIHADHFPIVVTDDSLVRYVRSQVRRPLIAKVHGSLGFKPKSAANDLTLSKEWCDALTEVFRNYTPVVIGYDGNDGSLMSLLETLCPETINHLWWCYYCPVGQDPLKVAADLPERIRNLILKSSGALIPIPGFDELMAKLLLHIQKPLKVPNLQDSLKEKSETRLKRYDAQWAKLSGGTTSKSAAKEGGKPDRQDATSAVQQEGIKQTMQELAKTRAKKPWWQWVREINAIQDVAKQDELYQTAIKELPDSSYLLSAYACFIYEERNDADGAEEWFQRAIEIDPENADNLGDYAWFLVHSRKDAEKAEENYKRALEIEPDNARILGNYALFLQNVRKDADGAEENYKCALENEPENASILGNYALFLKNVRKDMEEAEEYYTRAIEADPKDADWLGIYAVFLDQVRKDAEGAEGYYQRAIEEDPEDWTYLGNYGQLKIGKGEFNEGVVLLRRAWNALRKSSLSNACEVTFSLWLGSLLVGCEENVWLLVFRHCVDKGFDRPVWNFANMLAQAREHLSPDQVAYAEALAAAFLDAGKVENLKEFPQWKQVKPIAPELVDADGTIRNE